MRLLLPGILLASSARSITLITFDVDGTLVRGSGKLAEASMHARAFAHAVGTVLGDDQPTRLPAELLPPEKYHGSTDGLIALNMAHEAFGTPPQTAKNRLPEVFSEMYSFFAGMSDENAVAGIEALPGVLECLTALAEARRADKVLCGLVTGNVEGIARKKMRGVGVLATDVLSPAASEQNWPGELDAVRRARSFSVAGSLSLSRPFIVRPSWVASVRTFAPGT